MVYLIVSDGTHGRWELFESKEEALEAWGVEEQREKKWLKGVGEGFIFYPWNKSLLIKLGEVVQVKTSRSSR
jgi:hypothetical protein